MINTEEIYGRASTLEIARAPWNSFWDEISKYVMPRKAEVTRLSMAGGSTGVEAPSNTANAMIFDSTAIRSNQILANGQLSWMTPHESRWFEFQPPYPFMRDDEAKQWYRQCTEIAQGMLARSNFYSEIHELYLDRGGYGTAVINTEEGSDGIGLYFSNWDVGSYSLCENDQGKVDTCFRRITRTARQLAQQFGVDKLPKDVAQCLDEPKKYDTPWEVIHAIFPRDPRDVYLNSIDPRRFPIASVTMMVKEHALLKEGGYFENPFGATRFLKWGASVYGWSPSWMALPDARQVSYLEMNLDALAEVAAFPRLMLPAGYEYDLDLHAGGRNYFNPAEPNARPEEWLTGGRYDMGLDRANRKREAIEKAFHVDLFQMFANLDKQMTAREVTERHSEKLIQFSPTFARMTTELFQPLLARVFSILLRQGAFPPPPDSVFIGGPTGAVLPEPKIEFTSRIALAIAGLENAAFARTMDMVLPIAQLKPEILDNYDFDTISRDMARNDGMPARWFVPLKSVMQERQARAQQMAQIQQMEQAQLGAKAARDLGSIPPESPMAAAMLPGT